MWSVIYKTNNYIALGEDFKMITIFNDLLAWSFCLFFSLMECIHVIRGCTYEAIN